MELSASLKRTYLLEANLEVLHEESREWLNEINYWRDEMAFFYTLMVKKIDKKFFSEIKDKLVRIQEDILQLSGKEFSDLEISINQHENYLASLFESNSLKNEKVYREKHKIIAARINDFSTRIRELKKEIFILTKNHQV